MSRDILVSKRIETQRDVSIYVPPGARFVHFGVAGGLVFDELALFFLVKEDQVICSENSPDLGLIERTFYVAAMGEPAPYGANYRGCLITGRNAVWSLFETTPGMKS